MSQNEYAQLVARDGAPVMLQGVTATGDLNGLLFEVRVEQRFCNPTDKNMEVVYTFPLPWGAVLMGVNVLLGDKHLSGAVVEKKLAEARYEEALSEGNAAIMLEKNHDLSYSLNLGNLAAKETCVITLLYAQTLQFEQRGLRLMIPTVIAPRFGDAVIDGGLQPHQAPIHSLTVDYPFKIELRLHGDLARARVACPSHPIGIAHTLTEGSSVLTVSLGRSASLDRDFVLVIDQLTQESVAVLARDKVEAEGIVAMASFCPRIPEQGAVDTAVKILVDCSGSMGGDSMGAAKGALKAIVDQFGQGDKFSLSRFGSTVEHRSRGLWSVTATTRFAARRWVGSLNADLGGTEMESALESTFALAHTLASDVLLITDGEISAIDRTIEAAQASTHRVFVVGIGSSPAEAHLRRLAEATGGACDFVAPGEAVEPAILRMFARLRSPRLNDVTVTWPDGFSPEWATNIPKSVFDGDTVNLYAMARLIPSGAVRLMARVANGNELVEIGSTQFNATVLEGDTLSRMAVANRLQRKNTDLLVGTKVFTRDLALAYQLVTDQTNFLLIHERAEQDKPKDMPELHKVSQMLAAGWGGVGSVCVNASPVVFRSAARSSIRFSRASAADSSDAYEIPAFCRKASAPAVWRTSDRKTTVENVSMSPMGLCSWLRSTPELSWPADYQGLCNLGVDRWVVEWLEITIAANCGKAVTEQIVVKTFLFVMARRDTFDQLSLTHAVEASGKGLLQIVKTIFSTVHGASGTGVDLQLADEIAAALHDMSADLWPEQVYGLVAI
jgi:Ca-activated chloride channel family protein